MSVRFPYLQRGVFFGFNGHVLVYRAKGVIASSTPFIFALVRRFWWLYQRLLSVIRVGVVRLFRRNLDFCFLTFYSQVPMCVFGRRRTRVPRHLHNLVQRGSVISSRAITSSVISRIVRTLSHNGSRHAARFRKGVFLVRGRYASHVIGVKVSVYGLVKRTRGLSFRHIQGHPYLVIWGSVPSLPNRVRSFSIFFRFFCGACTLFIIIRPTFVRLVRRGFSYVSGQYVPRVVPRYCHLGRVFVRPRHLHGNSHVLQCFGHVYRPHPMVVSRQYRGGLHLAFRSPRELAIRSAIAIPLGSQAGVALQFLPISTL